MKNEIFIRTDKGAYVGGEFILGQVFLAVGHAIQAKKMVFEIVGYEKGNNVVMFCLSIISLVSNSSLDLAFSFRQI